MADFYLLDTTLTIDVFEKRACVGSLPMTVLLRGHGHGHGYGQKREVKTSRGKT